MKRTCNNSIARKNHLQAIVMGKYASHRSPVGLYYASYARNTFPMIMRRWGFITRRLRAYFVRETRDEFDALSHLDNSEINWSGNLYRIRIPDIIEILYGFCSSN